MSSQVKSPWTEEDIPSSYNEFESEEDHSIPLRTIVEFELFDKSTGELAYFDDLSDSSRHISLRGFVVEPLPTAWRDTFLNLLSTTPSEQLDLNIATTSSKKKKSSDVNGNNSFADDNADTDESQIVSAILDWETLAPGDNVDGYCNKTFKWYEAKVVAVDKEKNRFKVHFQGWKSKYDEWIDKYSQRLVAFRTSQTIMEEAVKNAAKMVPWYQHTLLMKRAQEMMKKQLPSRQSAYVIIDKLDDWCIDFTYANPTLWLIANENWYRVAGALCPGGCFGSPTDSYRQYFFSALEKYLCAAHTSMILLDQLPTNPGVTFQAVMEEVFRRSVGMVNELNCLQHYQFLTDQLCNIELPSEWDPKVTIVKSLFMNQLRREGEGFIDGGGMGALLASTYKGPRVKKRSGIAQQYAQLLIDLNQGDINAFHDAALHLDSKNNKDKPPKSAKKSRKSKVDEDAGDASVEITKAKTKKIKIEFPMDDSQLWSYEFQTNSKKCSPIPEPKMSDQLLKINIKDPNLSFHYHNLLLTIMTTSTNFRNTLKLPVFHLRDLETTLASSTSAVQPLLRQMCISMLVVIIRAYALGGLIKTSATAALAEVDEDENDCREPLVIEAAKSDETLLKFLQVGDTWIELTKIICEKVDFAEFAIAIEGATNPLRTCQAILSEIVQQFSTLPFSHPIDPDLHGLSDYFDIIEEPMDFGAIKLRLASGWYDSEDTYSYGNFVDNESMTASGLSCGQNDAHFDATIIKLKRSMDPFFQVGQFVDLYDDTLKKWVEGVVESREYDVPTNNLIRASQEPTVTAYWIRRIGLPGPTFANVRVEVNEDRLAFHRVASSERLRRVMIPTEFFAKYPQHAPMNHEDWTLSMLGSHVNSSRYAGHRGFAKDMRLVWRNCVRYYGHFGEGVESNEFVQEAKKMEVFFEREYQKRILRFVCEDQVASLSELISETYENQYYRPVECWKLALKALASAESRDDVHDAIPQISGSEDLEMLHVLANMRQKSFLDLDVAEKIVFLHWLCYSFLDTDFVHNELNITAQAQKQLLPLKQLFAQQEKDIKDTAMDIDDLKEENDEGNDGGSSRRKSTSKFRTSLSHSASKVPLVSADSAAATMKTPASACKNGKKRDREEDEANTNDTNENKASAMETPSTKKKPRANDPSVESSVKNNIEKDNEKQTFVMLHRHDCLGLDRFGNRYWVFSDHCTHVPTLFCEIRFQVGVPCMEYTVKQPQAPRWALFSHPQDLSQLVAWLDERGNSEAMLLRGIYEWLNDNNIILPAAIKESTKGAPDFETIAEETPAIEGNKSGSKRKTEERFAYELISKWRKEMEQTTVKNRNIELTHFAHCSTLSSTEIRERLQHFMSLNNQTTRLFLLHVTFSSKAKQLGMGVKAAADGAVYVTSFSSIDSITKTAGFYVGDRILYAGTRLHPNVSTLVDMVKKASQEIDSDPSGKATRRLLFIVRRMVEPREDPMFREIVDKDHDIVKQCNNTKLDFDNALFVAEKQFCSDPHFNESVAKLYAFSANKMQVQPGLYNEILTIFLEMWIKLAHPAFTTHYFRMVLLEGWLAKLLEVATEPIENTTENTAERGSLLCQYVARAMLDLEWDLYRVGSVLCDDWLGANIGLDGNLSVGGGGIGTFGNALNTTSTTTGSNNNNYSSSNVFVPSRVAMRYCHSRKRQQWRHFCRYQVLNVESLSYAVAIFMYQGVDWELFQRQLIPIPNTRVPEVLKQVGMEDDFVGYLLKEGSRLMYFGDGHLEASQADSDLLSPSHRQYFHLLADQYFRRPYNNVQLQQRLLPLRRSTVLWGDSVAPQTGAIWLCQVVKASVYNTTIPFVQLTLNILQPVVQNNQLFPAPAEVLPISNQKIALSRNLLRILQFIKRNNNCKPFLTAVSPEEYPSYCEVIQNPIDLGIIEKKINAQLYANHSQFLDDMQLLWQNCVDFYGAESKRFPPMARALLLDAQRLCRKCFDPAYMEGSDAVANGAEDVTDGCLLSQQDRFTVTQQADDEVEDEDKDGVKMDIDNNGVDVIEATISNNSSPMRRSGRLNITTTGYSATAANANSSDMVQDGVTEKEKTTAFDFAKVAPSAVSNTVINPPLVQQQQQLKSMTISVRLDRLWPTFLVEQDMYMRCLKRWNAGMITANKSTVNVEIAPDRQGNPRFASGVIVGNKEPVVVSNCNNSTAKVMPWEFIQVDWTEPADAVLLPSFVNCWDVEVLPDK